MKGTIELLGMQFKAFHGCLPQERLEGNLFVVDFSCEYDITAAAASDRLEDTLDYGDVYDIVAREMAVSSNLLEHVAARIADAVKAAHPGIVSLKVSVAKKNPPVAGDAEWSRVSLSL